jgi:SNF2 family DNA or RNA helicase
MVVRPKVKKLLLRLRDPTKVLTLIPTARPFQYKGVDLVVVPHRLAECKVLTNIGFKPPHPVEFYYDWPGMFTPMKAQRDTVAFLTQHNRAYCLNGMGSGKTLSSLWAFDYRRTEGLSKKLLVVAPLSTLERVWADELFKHLPHLSYAVLHGSKAQRLAHLARDVDVYVINHAGVKVIERELTARKDIDTVIIDELAQVARNKETDQWKALDALVSKRACVWGLTGTPTPNAPTDAWAQCRLITPSTVPQFFSHFRAKTMRQATTFKWIAKDEALEVVAEAMQPSIRIRREDCVDLPPVMYETREVSLSKTQQKLYDDMRDTLTAQYRGGEITAANAAVKLSRLVQIASGGSYDPDGNPIVIPPKARIQVVLDLIEEAASKVIVFVPFKVVLPHLRDEIGKHYSTAIISGDVGKRERDEIFNNFQHGKHPHVLVAQPAAMAHGLTLTAASVIVWFAPVTSAEIYEQANARITRPGQKHAQLIAHIQATPVEKQLYERLKDKSDRQNTLLDMFANGLT